jgi:hypothetical protein
MPTDLWEAAAKNYHAQAGVNPTAPSPSGETPNQDWRLWQQSDASTAAKPQEGFFRSLADSLGVPTQAPSLKDAVKNGLITGLEGPAGMAAHALYSGGKRMAKEVGDAVSDYRSGNKAGAAYHAITALPVIGPAMDKATDQYADGNYRGEVGTLLGSAAQMAPVALGAADLATPSGLSFDLPEIPTRAKAGRLFEDAMSKAGDQPVTISPETMKPLERTQQLSMAGGKPFGTADKLYQRIQTVNPLTYREARDFSQNMSLSPEEKMGLKKSMRYEVPKMAKSFNEDVARAADAAGKGAEHREAMSMYHRASRNAAIGKGLLKYGGRAALGAAGAGGLYEVGKAIKQ